MKIKSAKFIKGVVGTDDILDDGKPQIAFIGRSNVGKSSVINALTGQKKLARTSSYPGRTQELNLFLINNSYYLVDLPGYGYAKASMKVRERLEKLINWYLFDSEYRQKKIVLIIDADVGATESDLEILRAMESHGKNFIIVANKIDKIKNSLVKKSIADIQNIAGAHKVIPFSSEKKIGIAELINELLK